MRKHIQKILVGALAVLVVAVAPAGAHLNKKLKHLIKHLNPVFLNQNEKAADAQLLDGIDSAEFLRADATAADSDLLDGMDSSAFLPAGGTAADSDLLDGMDSGAFQRSFVRTVIVDTAAELIAAVGSASPNTMIQLEPGTFNVGTTMLSVPSGVTLQGAGIRTLIVGAGSADPNHAVLAAGGNTEIRSLVILNTGNQPFAVAARIQANARLFDVNAQAQNGTTESVAIDAVTGGGSVVPLLRQVGAFTLGAPSAEAIAMRAAGVNVHVVDSILQAFQGSGGTGTAFRGIGGLHRIERSILFGDTAAVNVTNGGQARVALTRLEGTIFGAVCFDVYDDDFAPVTCA
ncbi:MAG TPA: hypothetical protein VF097_02395 [Actinomycetota bacterium]